MNKKIFIIIAVILGILAMVIGIYFAWKKSKEILMPPAIQQPVIYKQQLPALVKNKLKILSDQPIFDYWVADLRGLNADLRRNENKNGNGNAEIFYLNQDGLIFKIKENGEDEAITSESIENLQSIKSSFDGKLVLIKFGPSASSGQSPQFVIFNSETKVREFLPENVSSAAFSPDAKKIIYLESVASGNSKTSNLTIKELTTAKPKISKILSLNQIDYDLEWILPEIVILTPKPSAFSADSALKVNIKTKTIELLKQNNPEGLMINWSVDKKINAKLGLQFNSIGENGFLTLIDEKGESRANLSFLTLPNKCFFSEPKIYCAVPLEIPPKTILPDDYLKRSVYFKDFLYQIDIQNNSFSEILPAIEPFIDAIHLNLIENKLLFINRYDNKLYSLEL